MKYCIKPFFGYIKQIDLQFEIKLSVVDGDDNVDKQFADEIMTEKQTNLYL